MPQNTRGRTWPAVDIEAATDADLVLAAVDDFGPTAVEPRGNDVRVFFATAPDRDAACVALRAASHRASPVDVDDGDWARRSQEGLRPVTIDRITVTPPQQAMGSTPPPEGSVTIVIQPSMGFGTGHHATTRLCLRALQTLDLSGRFALDIGTGSGVLALAAVRLGAARAIGIDNDADAIQSATENLALNPASDEVTFEVADLLQAPLPMADVITANLMGAFLVRTAELLFGRLRPGGILIVSGLLAEERDDVVRAFSMAPVVWEQEEEGWVALAMKRT